MAIEYRICWSASSNASFAGEGDWIAWDDEDATAEEVELELERGGTAQLSRGLEETLEASGFGWWVETREAMPS